MGYWKEETKELMKNFQGTDQIVVIKKLNAGEQADIGKECSKMTIMPGMTKGNIDAHQAKLVIVKKAIVKADFPQATMDDIRSIPGEFFEWIYDEINGFSEVNTTLKKPKSGGPSSSEPKT